MDIEYGYIYVKNYKVVGISPEHAYTDTSFPVDLDIVVNRLIEKNWELATDAQAAEAYKIRIERRADEWQPPVSEPNVRVVSVEVNASEAEFDVVVAEIRHLWEVNGWDLRDIWRKGGMNFGPTMFFSKPKNAPDVVPFIDPNKT
jgi:hypothetical protein